MIQPTAAPAPKAPVELVQAFKFIVTLKASPAAKQPATAELGDGFFAECSGLDLEADIQEYLEGGRNDGVIRRVGRVKLVPIVLKRGMFVQAKGADGATAGGAGNQGTGTGASGGYVNTALWDWLTGMVTGTLPIPRYDGMVRALAPTGDREVARWTFTRGLPSKVVGPALHARTGEIAIEELHIVHEGLQLWRPQS
jgi:phage tail-like protein